MRSELEADIDRVAKEIENAKRSITGWENGIKTNEKILADLQQQLAEIQEQSGRWRDTKDEGYYFLDTDGAIVYVVRDTEHVLDDYRYDIGNYHRTQEEAKAYRQAMLDVSEKEGKSRIEDYGAYWLTKCDYMFNTKAEAKIFAEQLKLILNVKE